MSLYSFPELRRVIVNLVLKTVCFSFNLNISSQGMLYKHVIRLKQRHLNDKGTLKQYIMMYPAGKCCYSLPSLVGQWHFHYTEKWNVWKGKVEWWKWSECLKIFRVHFLYLLMLQSALAFYKFYNDRIIIVFVVSFSFIAI